SRAARPGARRVRPMPRLIHPRTRAAGGAGGAAGTGDRGAPIAIPGLERTRRPVYGVSMPIPHQEMRRIIRRRIHGTEGAERIRLLEALLGELPGYQTGPYGELRKWVHQQIDAAGVRRAAKHRDALHVPKEGCAHVV